MKKPPQLPGAILMGAQSRLLPPLLPFMFMLAGVIFHLAAWGALAWAADEVPGYAGGPGPVLAAVHVLTLGVLVMTAMGAALQLLPVATGMVHKSLLSARLAWWLMTPGLIVLISGFYFADVDLMMIGAAPVVLALLIFAGVVGDILRRALTLRLTRAFIWLALVSLLGLLGLGVVLIFDIGHGFLSDHAGLGLMHMILAAYGFMGMLALGISNILVPMFALSPSPPARSGWLSFALALVALLLTLAGLVTGVREVLLPGVLAGLTAVAFHLYAMRWSLANGMRKNLGLSFVVIKLGWVMLVLSLILGGAVSLGWLGALGVSGGAAMFGFVVLYGWLLTFVTGILQRIIPFLAAMNMSKLSLKPPRLSELAPEWPLKIHALCHAVALALCLAGIALDISQIVRFGALIGCAGAAAFAWFTFSVARCYWTYQHTPDPISST